MSPRMYEFLWLLAEAECYVGCVPAINGLEAARRVVKYMDEVKAWNPAAYEDLLARAREYAIYAHKDADLT